MVLVEIVGGTQCVVEHVRRDIVVHWWVLVWTMSRRTSDLFSTDWAGGSTALRVQILSPCIQAFFMEAVATIVMADETASSSHVFEA